MSKCKLPYKSGEANAKSYLRTKGVIDQYLNIIDYPKFVKENRKLTEAGIKNYDIDGQWFYAENEGKKAVPNKELFRQVDRINKLPDPGNILQKEGNVNYRLKAVDILSSDKGKQIFTKGKKVGWDLSKILTELQIPKAQKQIILSKDITDREEIITSLLAENTFTVEVNTAKNTVNGWIHTEYGEEEVTTDTDTNYYANLTVPGGTNYKENEIATPDIIPNIKGHAQFSTDNGIGWFRSDEQAAFNGLTPAQIANIPEEYKQESLNGSKTRRILEVQSDLFQKGRNKKDLITNKGEIGDNLLLDKSQFEIVDFEELPNKESNKGFGTKQFGYSTVFEDSNYYYTQIDDNEYGKIKKDKLQEKPSEENQFLQLLNKNNNWVTFFIETIMQDSAKKGYEKVLFPKGDTAAKVEGHQTVEEFLKITNSNIKKLEDLNSKYETEIKEIEDIEPINDYQKDINDDDIRNYKSLIEQNNNSISSFKQELKDVEADNTKLSSIASFYENNVTNILNKKYKGRVIEITDEYGNKWNEVETTLQDRNEPLILALEASNQNKTQSFGSKFIFGDKSKQESIKPQQNFVLLEETRQANLNEIRDKLFNGNLTNTTANQILRNALYNLDLNDETRQIVKSLLTSRAKVKFVNKSRLVGNDTYAQYESDNRTIEINREILGTGNLMYAFESLLHEVIHDVTAHSIMSPKNDNQRDFRDLMEAEYKFFKSNADFNAYGFTNVHEFMAEIMSNQTFRDRLRQVKDDSGLSLLDRIIMLLKRLFGFNSSSSKRVDIVLDSILNIAENESITHNSPLTTNFILETKTEESKKNKYSKEFNDKLIDTKKLIKKILARIEAVKNKSRAAKGYQTETQEKFDKLQELMEDLYEKKSNEAVFEFTKFADSEIYSLLNILDKKVKDGKITSDFLARSKAYLSVYDSLNDIRNISTRQYDSGEITKKDYDNINESLSRSKNNFDIFHSRYIDLSRDLLAEKLAPYNNRPIDERKRLLEREFNSLGLKKSGINKNDWIEDKLNEEIEDLRSAALEDVRRQLEFVPMDIGGNTLNLVSEKNINNLIVQLLSSTIDKADMEFRDFAVHIRNQFYNRSKKYNAKGTTNKTRFGHLLAEDSTGGHYLISKYSPKFIEAYKEQKALLFEANDQYGFKSKESKIAYKKFLKWKNKNTITKYDKNGIVRSVLPDDKWINKDYAKLSKEDKSYVQFLTDTANEADELTLGYKSLVFKYTDAEFVKLPSIRQTELDKILSGNVVGAVKDKTGDLFKVREDATDRGELSDEELRNESISKKLVTINNEERHLVPIHYRSPIDPKDQSLDLPTIFLMNISMAKEFNVKQKLEADSQLLKDVIGDAEVTQTDAFSNKVWKSLFSMNKDELEDITIKGKDSNLYRKINSIIENRIYKITEAGSGKIFGKDIASVANGVAGYSANLALAVNYLSAIPNLMQGKIQNFIEGVGNGTFTRADLRWAEKTYFNELATGGIADVGKITNNSKLSMVIDKFDLLAEFNTIKNKFEDTSRFRALFKSSTLHGLNGAAEHYVQSTLSLAIMKTIKIKNANGEFINKDGKVVSEKDAMNLWEAFDVKDGKLSFNKNAHHSSFTRNRFSENGMLEHQSLLRKKIIDLHGQYDNQWQSHIQRYWYGKLIFMFRKWLIPAYHRRWRGAMYVNKNYEELSENQQYYDPSTREYVEGTYTSLARFMVKGVFPALKEFNIELATANWKQLTDKEKSNIHKTLRELLVTTMMATAAHITYLAAKDAPDDDDRDALYLAAYLFKRQETELMQYYSPSDQMRIFRTPFAAMSTIEKVGRWMNQLMPYNIGDKYEQGENKDQYKAWIKTKRLVPVISQTERSAEESLSYLKSISE